MTIAPKKYTFVTAWRVKAPLPEVWQVISTPLEWPTWWRGVKSVEVITEGDEYGLGQVMEYTFKSFLPYALTLRLELTERVALNYLKGKASGELAGWGEWHFTEQGEYTGVVCIWKVATTTNWMNTFAFVLRPLFTYNHTLVMKQGERHLKKKLGAGILQVTR